MKSIISSLLIIGGLYSQSVFAKPMTISAEDGFKLAADYYKPKIRSDRAVLMLHQCNEDRRMYDRLAKAMKRKGFHVLNLDFRGFGDSTDTEQDITLAESLPEDKRREYVQSLFSHHLSDAQQAYDRLRHLAGKDAQVGIVGASCGGWVARGIAASNPVDTIVFFSGAIYAEHEPSSADEFNQHVADLPLLVIAAEDDNIFSVSQEAFSTSRHANSQFIAYKGEAHGLPLIEQDPNLHQTIVRWLKRHVARD